MKKQTNSFIFLEQKPNIFFLGIGGVSMSSLAFTAKRYGCKVAGFDAAESDTTRKLVAEGIPVYGQFNKEHYNGVELVVYTGAIREDDVVFSYPKSLGIPMMPRAKFLGLLMKQCKNPIGVSGTHGKSSTTGMLSSIFLSAEGRDPTVMAGAILPELDSTYRLGSGEDFLFEACEYQNSFLDFFPHIAVILNVEHDHADFFPTLEDMIRSFTAFADIAKDGKVILLRADIDALPIKEESGEEFSSDNGNMHAYQEHEIIEKITEGRGSNVIFSDKENVIGFIKELQNINYSISVTCSGLEKSVREISDACGLKIHSVNMSLGVFGNTAKLPRKEVLEITTMCGHHQVSPLLVEEMAKQVREKKITSHQAAKNLVRPCPCGVVNFERAKEIIDRLASE